MSDEPQSTSDVDAASPAVTTPAALDSEDLARSATLPGTDGEQRPAESPAAASLVGTVVADRYRVHALLGSGGMGSVYRAEHVHMRKQVALKVLHPEMTQLEEAVARFEREAIAAARIEHVNVAKAGDFGKLGDGSFYLVLEYVAGQSLASCLRGGPLPLERALGITAQVVDALVAAHAAGIVHRDLKPDNVMLVEVEGGHDLVKVLDFGIAKVDLGPPEGAAQGIAEAPSITRIGTVFGTPGYMAPEQAVGQAADHRADLYAVGVMLYEMIAGRLPFDGNNVTQILAAQLTSTPPDLPAGTPEQVCALVTALLAKQADRRIQTSQELAQRIHELADDLSHESPMAPAYADVFDASSPAASPRQRIFDFVRSGRGRIAAASAVAIAAVLTVLATAGSTATATSTSTSTATPAPTFEPLEVSAGPKRAFKQAVVAARQSAEQARARRAAERAAAERAAAERAAAEASESDSTTSTASSRTSSGSKKGSSGSGGKKRRTGPGGIYIPPPSEWF